MEKIIKKSYGFVFVLAILLAFALNVVPAKANSEGSLTIRKFDVSRYDNLKESTGVEEDKNNLPTEAVMMADVEFKVEKLLRGIGDTNVTPTAPVDPKFTARIQRTDSNGETKFDNLPIGYYLVTETIPKGFDAPGEGKFVVAIPTEVIDERGASNLNYDVVLYPKNQKIMVEKVLNSERKVVGIGDVFSWTINYPMFEGLKKIETDSKGNQTTYYGKNFFITDEMDSRLDYVDGSANMKFLNGAGVPLALDLLEGTDYNITYDASTHILKIAFTDNGGTKKIADAGVTNIELTIDTAVNASAIDTVTSMHNNARIVFTNASGDPFEHEVFPPGTDPEDSRVPKVYLGTIDITKVDSEDESVKLAGATFALSESEKQAKSSDFIRSDVVTDEYGIASISAIGEGTYYLVETKAPVGYQLSSNPIEVSVANDSSMRITNITISNVKIEGISPTITPEVSPGADITPGAITPGAASPGATDQGTAMLPKGSAKTGDTTQILGFIFLGVASIGMVGYLVKRRKQQTQ